MDTIAISTFLERGFLVSPDFHCTDITITLQQLEHLPFKPFILSSDFITSLATLGDINWLMYEKSKAFFEKFNDSSKLTTFLSLFGHQDSPIILSPLKSSV